MAKKKTCTNKRCVNKRDSARYAKAKKERRRLLKKSNTLQEMYHAQFSETDMVLWSLVDFIESTPPSPTNICAGRWADAMLAMARYYDCIAGQVEV